MQWQGWLFSCDLPDPDPDWTTCVPGDSFHAPDGGGQRDEAPQGPGNLTPVAHLCYNHYLLCFLLKFLSCSPFCFLYMYDVHFFSVKYYCNYLLQKERRFE